MAKLFVAVVPDSECERNVKKILRAFDKCKSIVKECPEERDCNYYEMDDSNYPGLAEVIHRNLAEFKYSSMGLILKQNPLMQFTYGYYRSCVKNDNSTLEDFINTEG